MERKELTDTRDQLRDQIGERNRSRRHAGITLIELGFVVGIIAVIVVGVLTIYNSVTAQQAVTDVTSDVAAIRTAVSTWASGRPLNTPKEQQPVGVEGVDYVWDKWADISNCLPGDLGQVAESTQSTTLTKVNSNWPDVEYQFDVDSQNPYLWTLTIAMIPDQDDAQTLGKRLGEGAEMTKVVSAGPDSSSVAVTYSL